MAKCTDTEPTTTVEKVAEGVLDGMDLLGGGASIDHTRFLEQDYKIEFYSLATHIQTTFKAFVKSFSDTYECRWESTTGVGRNDPIQSYQGTGRKISIEWDVVAHSAEEARKNLKKCEALIKSMYPVMRPAGGVVRAIESPPYFRFKFANLASDRGGMGPVDKDGLFVTCAGIEYAPDFDAGVFTSPCGNNNIYPKLVSLNVELTVLHDHDLGFGTGGSDHGAFSGFPYGTIKGTPPDLVMTQPEAAPATQSEEANAVNSGALGTLPDGTPMTEAPMTPAPAAEQPPDGTAPPDDTTAAKASEVGADSVLNPPGTNSVLQ